MFVLHYAQNQTAGDKCMCCKCCFSFISVSSESVQFEMVQTLLQTSTCPKAVPLIFNQVLYANIQTCFFPTVYQVIEGSVFLYMVEPQNMKIACDKLKQYISKVLRLEKSLSILIEAINNRKGCHHHHHHDHQHWQQQPETEPQREESLLQDALLYFLYAKKVLPNVDYLRNAGVCVKELRLSDGDILYADGYSLVWGVNEVPHSTLIQCNALPESWLLEGPRRLAEHGKYMEEMASLFQQIELIATAADQKEQLEQDLNDFVSDADSVGEPLRKLQERNELSNHLVDGSTHICAFSPDTNDVSLFHGPNSTYCSLEPCGCLSNHQSSQNSQDSQVKAKAKACDQGKTEAMAFLKLLSLSEQYPVQIQQQQNLHQQQINSSVQAQEFDPHTINTGTLSQSEFRRSDSSSSSSTNANLTGESIRAAAAITTATAGMMKAASGNGLDTLPIFAAANAKVHFHNQFSAHSHDHIHSHAQTHSAPRLPDVRAKDYADYMTGFCPQNMSCLLLSSLAVSIFRHLTHPSSVPAIPLAWDDYQKLISYQSFDISKFMDSSQPPSSTLITDKNGHSMSQSIATGFTTSSSTSSSSSFHTATTSSTASDGTGIDNKDHAHEVKASSYSQSSHYGNWDQHQPLLENGESLPAFKYTLTNAELIQSFQSINEALKGLHTHAFSSYTSKSFQCENCIYERYRCSQSDHKSRQF
jgi:hypothetical protein